MQVALKSFSISPRPVEIGLPGLVADEFVIGLI
jgi:hypothetical protein